MHYQKAIIIILIVSLTIPFLALAETATRTQSAILNATVEPIGYIPPELAPYLGLWGTRRVPKIFDVRILDITRTSARIIWQTDIVCTTELFYGQTIGYELGRTNDGTNSLWLEHEIILIGLKPGTEYHFRIRAQDSQGTVALSGDYSFKTSAEPDFTPPADVLDFIATPGNAFIKLTWKNPPDSDFAGVRILRSEVFYPERECLTAEGHQVSSGTLGVCDGVVLVYDGKAEEHNDLGLTNGTRYYYTAYAYDFTGNFSSGAIASAVPGEEYEGPYIPPYPEVPTELTLADFRFFVAHDSLEIFLSERQITEWNDIATERSDVIVDKENALITPLTDAWGVIPTAQLKILEGSILTTVIEKDKLPDILKTIILRIGESGYILKISDLIPLAMRMSDVRRGDTVNNGVNKVNKVNNNESSSINQVYRVTNQVSQVTGIYPLIVLILIYRDGTKSTISGELVVEQYGKIKAEVIGDPTVDFKETEDGLVIRGAEVRLYRASQKLINQENIKTLKHESNRAIEKPASRRSGQDASDNRTIEQWDNRIVKTCHAESAISREETDMWPAQDYFQFNPQITNQNGEYGFMVPNGRYYLEVAINGRQPVKTKRFEVTDNLVNHQVVLKLLEEAFYKKFGFIQFLKFLRDFLWFLALLILLLIILREATKRRKRNYSDTKCL
ncbi:fibronectin type III domain-containing protein [Patescibacteria group bacterium]|nr:fibronectin type III domain-containing protein [Patescibacteria group bacterium]MCG2690736.1 fibronectin type III domain-containing protein [Candidatus Parcubacteria bacterium]